MKTKISHLGRSTVSVILAVMMILSTMLIGTISVNAADYFTVGDTLYLDISGASYDATEANAGFYIKFYKQGHNDFSWSKLSQIKDKVYSGTVPTGEWDRAVFTRVNSQTFDSTKSWIASTVYSSATTTISDKGNHNCWSLNNGNMNGTWTTYSGGSGGGSTEATYYLGGRVGQNLESDTWLGFTKDYEFQKTETSGLYKYVSKQTPAQWTQTIGNSKLKQYFFVHTGSNAEWYGSTQETRLTSANQATTLKNYYNDNDTNNNRLLYIDSSDTSGNVTFWFDTRNSDKQLYYTVGSESSQTPVAQSVSLTASPEIVTSGGSTKLTATLTNKATGVDKVTYTFKKADGTLVSTVTDSAENTASVDVNNITSDTTYTVTVSATNYSDVSATATVTVKTTPKAELLYGTTDPLNSTTSFSMTYDAESDCFYYVVDSNLYNNSFRFRFSYNGKQYGADWETTYPASKTVNVDGDKVDVNKDVSDWENKPGCKVGNATSKFTIWFDANNFKTWIVNAEAPKYTVTYGVNGGNGTLTADGVTSGSTVNSGTEVTFTATPSKGFAVEGWYSDADCKNAITDAGTKTSYEVTVNANTNVYVKFKSTTIDPEYRLTGDLSAIGGWNGYDSALKFDTAESDGSYSKILTVTSDDANSKHFKLIKSENGSDKYYGPDKSTYDIILSNSSDTAYNTYENSGSGNDFYFSKAGTYKIHYFIDTTNSRPSVWVEENTTKYNVTVAESIKSSASVDKTKAAKDETVTVTATPGTGEVLQSVTVVGDDHTPVTTTVSGNTATFTMPSQDVTVTEVTFREAKTCKVTFRPSDEKYGEVTAQHNETAFATGNTVTEGDTVTFTAKPNSGYVLSNWTVNGESVSATNNPYTITVNKDTTVVANFVTGTPSGYYLLCGEDPTFQTGKYTPVPLYTNEEGVYYADFDATNITKKKDYYIIFSRKEDTSGIIVETNNVTINTVDNNGFSLGSRNDNVQNSNGGSNNVKFAKVYINSDDVTGFTIKITGLDLDKKKITYSAVPTFDVAPADTVEITAKDGTIRGTTATIAALGNTTIEVTTPEGKTLKATDSFSNKAQTVKKVPDKSTVKVTTTIDESKTFAGVSGSGYYVKGFSINGIFGGVLSQSEGKSHDSDVYTFEFTVNQELYNETKLEITPVYFLKDDSNCVYFYIENYDSAKQIWGNTPSCYVYYGSGTTTLEALGYYPGQPMVDYNGSIFTQIPKYIVSDGTQVDITGMTLNNYVWDDVHSAYNGKKQKEDNAQTYDYDDFVKIAESSVVNAENIIYRFKYNTHNNVPKDTLDTSDTDADGWEVFLDYQNYPTDIFGKKLGNEKLDYKDLSKVTGNEEYLSIISDGYQDNYIGQYATAWSIYNKAGNRVATIPSSALLYALGKSDSEMQTAIASASIPPDFLPGKKDRDKHWATFKTLYQSYQGLYARINFEASIKDGKDYGNRLDGRWYYTKSQQDITGEIKIQYANTLDDYNKVGGFHDDKFANDQPSSIEGITTGASAYFTNPKDKVRKLETFADNTQDYKFEVNATSTAAYTFVGWYRLIDGDYKAINPSDMSSLTGAVTRNSDVTLVARYIKTPGGSMTFQHSLYEGENAGGGKATTEIQVVVKDNTGEPPLYDSGKIAGTASIDKTKIAELAKKEGLTVTVTLYTTTKNLYNFNGYYSAENTTVTEPFTTGFTTTVTGDRTKGLETKSKYTFSFNEYYNEHRDTLIGDNAGTVYYNFYSDITSIKVPYKVQFSYTDRMGDQKYYNKAGYVDPENTSSYTIVEKNTETNGEGSKAVEVTLTNSFILSLAPYESNFTKNLTWNKTPVSNTAFDSSDSKSIASAVVNSTQSDRTIHLNVFRDNDTKEPTSRDNQNGAFVLYEKGGSAELPYGSVFYTKNDNGTYTYDITAPKTYKDNQFMYWAIYSDEDCNNLVIKAYNSEGHFSYVAYDNCWIVPVYGESSTPVASVKEVSASTQFMEVTRNQWTAVDADSFTGFDADNMKTLDTAQDFIKGNDEDKLYADFVLNFFYNGKQLSVFDPKSNKVQTGIVMQKLELENDSIGVGYNTDMEHYANKYIKDLPEAAEDAKSLILTGKSSIESLTKQIDNNRLDNKNRLQYYARFNNTEANVNCVYRVYTYIKYVNESNEPVVELGKPIYFTLYDIANATV